MKSLLFTVALSSLTLLGIPHASAERPLVAVLDFQEIETGLAAHEVELLADIARGEALDALGEGYNIITRENLLDLLNAHGTDLAQCQGACETETGRLIGADFVVSGSVVRAFGSFKVNLKLHRTSPPELLGAAVRTAESQASLEAQVRLTTSDVLRKLSGASARQGDEARAPASSPSPRSGGERTVARGDASLGVLGALSPGAILGGLLGGSAPVVQQGAAPQNDDEEAAAEPEPEVDGGLHVLVDLGGLLFFGPTVVIEVGGKTRFSTWYRAVDLGLLATNAFINPETETYEEAFGVGAGVRWYGRGHTGMDGLWYGLGAEYYSGNVFNDSTSLSGGNYITKAILAEGLVGYRWGSEDWANQVGAGLAIGFELEFSQPEGGEEVFQRVYPVLIYEIEFF